MVRDYALDFQDPLMLGEQYFPWFNTFVVCEVGHFVCTRTNTQEGFDFTLMAAPRVVRQMFLQFPFFFFATWALWTRALRDLHRFGVR